MRHLAGIIWKKSKNNSAFRFFVSANEFTVCIAFCGGNMHIFSNLSVILFAVPIRMLNSIPRHRPYITRERKRKQALLQRTSGFTSSAFRSDTLASDS